MSFSVTTRQAENVKDLDPTVYLLQDDRGSIAEIWPALGFNCFRWSVLFNGVPLELLYADPALFQGARSTRSGIPVLFPFPNRIRDGKFTWSGKEFQLPLNDPAQKNSIHGFACRVPWRIVEKGADRRSAWVTGEFHCWIDAPDSLKFWPADHKIQVTIRLTAGALRLEAVVSNPDTVPLPFGLGYHPYFHLPFTGTTSPEDCIVQVPATNYWPLEGNLPSGTPEPIPDTCNLNHPRRLEGLQLDDVLTDLPRRPARMDGLIERASITSGEATLRLFCDTSYREMVVYTPPHRQAFCVEPYTCPTDAINLTAKDQNVGWMTLAPGETWQGTVEMWV